MTITCNTCITMCIMCRVDMWITICSRVTMSISSVSSVVVLGSSLQLGSHGSRDLRVVGLDRLGQMGRAGVEP